MNKYFINTYGCQMNIHESEKLANALSELGYSATDEQDKADVIVFNTCCIRENAENHVYGNVGALKGLKKKNKNLIIAVGGCMTQQKGAAEKLKKRYPYVDIIFGTHNLSDFKEMLLKKLNGKKSVIEILEKEKSLPEDEKSLRTSYPNAWVNIMYGCNNFCTYCIVPYVRGRERSRSSDDIYSEVNALVNEGYKEITLLGQNVNSYGKDLDCESFPLLLKKLSAIKGKYRLRFMTNHPKDLSEDMVKVVAESPNICKCIHLPVQSGSDKVLAAMHRRYTSKDYLEKLNMLRKYIPDCQVTTDIMVGFPGETEEDFQDTLNLVKKADFAGAFTFVYSKRSGTAAAEMNNQIDEDVKKDRIVRLVDLVNELNRNKSVNYNGKIIEILCDDYDEKKGTYLGRDEYGRMAYFKSDKNVKGEFVKVKITETGGISLFGEIVD